MASSFGEYQAQILSKHTTSHDKLDNINLAHGVANGHKAQHTVHLSGIETNSATTATKLTNLQTINDTKLSAIQTFLDKDSGANFHNAQIHTKLDQANTHHTTAHGHQTTSHSKLDQIITNTANIKLSADSVNLNVDGLETLQTSTNTKLDTINTTNTSNNSALVSIRDVNLPQIHNDLVGVSGFTSGSNTALVNIRDTNLPQIHNDLVGIDTAIDEAKDAVNLLKNDNGARLDTLNTTISGTTNIKINETNTILTNKTQFSMEAPPLYPAQTSLGNATRLNDGLSSGLTDVIDMNGFRSLAVSVLLTGNSGQTPLSDKIYFYASFDNSTFFNTGSFGTIVEATEGGASGEYKTFKFGSNFGARYIKLGSHLGFGNVSAITVNYVRFNGGF